jgi:regulator of CtrA degradation
MPPCCAGREAMAEKQIGEQPVSFGARLAASQSFSALFREGMKLVEETASYLDGPGRKESKKLDRGASLTYATESMRLTTRLMQLASWLLLHRAVNEGEMSLAQANKEKTKVKLAGSEPVDDNSIKMLPESLRTLIGRAQRLHVDVRRLDATIHAPVLDDPIAVNPLDRQIGLLRAAFERNEH